MALSKTGYSGAIQGTTKVNVAITEDGRIAGPNDTAAGNKKFTVKTANAENSLSDNTEVLNFFIGLANGRSDSTTNVMQVTWEV